ncbi:unnamed protein product, partial [Polarella glacialis]
ATESVASGSAVCKAEVRAEAAAAEEEEQAARRLRLQLRELRATQRHYQRQQHRQRSQSLTGSRFPTAEETGSASTNPGLQRRLQASFSSKLRRREEAALEALREQSHRRSLQSDMQRPR